MTAYVLDAAWGWPDLAAAKRAGYTGIIGYLSNNESKNLTASRVAEARRLGLTVNAVWEGSAKDFTYWTIQQATAAGVTAALEKLKYGLPAVLPVFCGVDTDVAPSQYPKIVANVLAFAKAAGGAPAVYGEAGLIDYALAHGVTHGWQAASMAWSGYKVSPNACLLQLVHKNLPVVKGSYDENKVLKLNYGQWGFVAPAPKPVPKPVPVTPVPRPPAPVPVPKPVAVVAPFPVSAYTRPTRGPVIRTARAALGVSVGDAWVQGDDFDKAFSGYLRRHMYLYVAGARSFKLTKAAYTSITKAL